MRALTPHPHVIELLGYCYDPLAIYLQVRLHIIFAWFQKKLNLNFQCR